MLKHYFNVTKPGIVTSNRIFVTGEFFLAARGEIDWLSFAPR
ncbi:hypothetical protein PVT68_09590 [Microbulbifer bruguierae]|uniref:Uncharacterized protein n=1 Tax=Microbulbifer bruguierae TaxID=3029061 RepID=A0ABY8NB61_9GAMM|nr:hypothetical protein [Microbulbifer bruguierae]WGL15032.1 hypothetical protein PVT68_09590 [Microbulbifer bruguierae]